MNPREQSTILISRGYGLNAQGIATVLISPQSVRKFHLMTEDCIVLRFNLDANYLLCFNIGDWFTDELFGTFVLRQQQMPNYNKSTGGYEYELLFDKAYRQLEDYIFMMTSLETVNNVNTFPRRETNWYLTAPLATHLDEVVRNINTLDLPFVGTGWTYSINSYCKKKDEIKYLNYDGVHILSAMTALAEAFECEWWVDDANKVIYFGKCEGNNEPYEMILGDNVETMDISKNENDFANRIYALGSTRNLPSSYRKSLKFIVGAGSLGYPNWFYDTSKEIKTNMLHGGEEDVHLGMQLQLGTRTHSNNKTTLENYSVEYLEKATYTFSGALYVNPEIFFPDGNQGNYSAKLTISLYQLNANPQVETTLYTANKTDSSCDFNVSFEDIVVGVETTQANRLRIVIEITTANNTANGAIPSSNYYVFSQDGGSPYGCITARKGLLSQFALLTFNGSTYPVMRTDKEINGITRSVWKFVDRLDDSDDASSPSGFVIGSEYTINFYDPTAATGSGNDNCGLIITKIPTSWFLDDYDNPTSLRMLGERRLRMPASTPAVAADDYVETETPNPYPVEMVAIFEEIFPKCYLKVTSVTETRKTTDQELEDGSRKRWEWTEYSFTAKNLSGAEFPFSTIYIADGEKLEAVWLSDTDRDDAIDETVMEETYTPGNGHLAGMNFALGYNNTSKMYTIVRNNDYGAMLPNDTVKPTIGDVFVLTGWDVRAMNALGLIAIAEEKLETAATEYLNAIEQGQFTFGCHMMSDSALVDEEIIETEEIDITDTASNLSNPARYINNSDVWKNNVNARSRLVPVTPGMNVKITRGNDQVADTTEIYAFMTNRTSTVDSSANYSSIISGKQPLARGTSITVTVPNDANYLYLYMRTTSKVTVDITVKKILTTTTEIKAISLLPEGTVVEIHSNILKVGINEDYKLTRVLGYEFKLDMPYDTPKYVCGETDAYSRIKQLEKKITKR